jgi:hypothetical protein
MVFRGGEIELLRIGGFSIQTPSVQTAYFKSSDPQFSFSLQISSNKGEISASFHCSLSLKSLWKRWEGSTGREDEGKKLRMSSPTLASKAERHRGARRDSGGV